MSKKFERKEHNHDEEKRQIYLTNVKDIVLRRPRSKLYLFILLWLNLIINCEVNT